MYFIKRFLGEGKGGGRPFSLNFLEGGTGEVSTDISVFRRPMTNNLSTLRLVKLPCSAMNRSAVIELVVISKITVISFL